MAQLAEDIDSNAELLCAAGCASARNIAASYNRGKGVVGLAAQFVTDTLNSAKAGLISVLGMSSDGQDDIVLSSSFLVDYGFVDKDEIWTEPVEFEEKEEPPEVVNMATVEWKIVDDFEEEKDAEHSKKEQVHNWEPAYVSPWMLPPENNFIWKHRQT